MSTFDAPVIKATAWLWAASFELSRPFILAAFGAQYVAQIMLGTITAGGRG